MVRSWDRIIKYFVAFFEGTQYFSQYFFSPFHLYECFKMKSALILLPSVQAASGLLLTAHDLLISILSRWPVKLG